jgi:flagellar biosynthesis/type III secretory pathway protein FliH
MKAEDPKPRYNVWKTDTERSQEKAQRDLVNIADKAKMAKKRKTREKKDEAQKELEKIAKQAKAQAKKAEREEKKAKEKAQKLNYHKMFLKKFYHILIINQNYCLWIKTDMAKPFT